MLLVTTPHFTPPQEEERALLLGEWCRRPGSDITEGTVLPYHWNDRELLYQDYLYLDDLCERWLPLLAERLNAIHGLDRPLRYWRLVAGYWFMLCAAVIRDRFRSIETASKKADRTLALPSDGTETITKDSTEFIVACTESDIWNHHCYLDIIRAGTAIKLETVPAPENAPKSKAPRRLSLRDRVKAGLVQLSRIGLGARPVIVPIGLHIPPAANLKLARKLRQVPFLAPEITAPPNAIQPQLRQQLALDSEHPFEKTFGGLLPKLIPASFVEDFAYLRGRSLALLPKQPATIVTGQFHVGQDAICIWAAEQREHGSKIHIVQHGGHYGVDRFEAAEDHELRIADRYYSWGWTRDGFTNIVPTPALQLSSMRPLRPKPEGEILFVYDAICPYSYRLFCIPSAGQREIYIKNQVALIAALPESIRKHSRLRLHPLSDTYHFGLRQAFHEQGWENLIDSAKHTLQTSLSSARICVATANATVLLQTLAADFPTILFWNPLYNELRPEAEPYYKLLVSAGILHYRTEAASHHVVQIFPNVAKWWTSPEVQDARCRFIERFARSSQDWADIWRDELLGRQKSSYRDL